MPPQPNIGKDRKEGSVGFTLIELLIVVVILGILAAVSIPQFSKMKNKSYEAVMKEDLRNLATAQELYFSDQKEYAPSLAELKNSVSYFSSDGVTITIREAEIDGWSATADYGPLVGSDDCGFFAGSASAPTGHLSGSVSGTPSPDVPFCKD